MNNENKSNNLPLIIIGGVLVAGIVLFYFFYSGAGSTGTKTNSNKSTAANKASEAELYSKASPGANPPNSLGTPSASVTIEEFADFQCPTCAGMHPVIKEIRGSYGDQVRIIFREFPLNIPAHDKGYDAAVAAEAAGLQGKFWDMQNLLFSNQQAWSRDPNYRKVWEGYAEKIGLDVDKFTTDMAGIVTKNRVDADLQRGRSLNVNSTPTIYINGKSVALQDFSVEGMRRLIDAELQKSQPKQ